MPCGIHELPNELLDQILNLLDQPDLGRLGLVCRVLHARCTPLLYKEVTFTYLTARRNMNIIDDPMMEENNEQPQKTLISILKTLSEPASYQGVRRHILETVAIYQGESIQELELCGLVGGPALWTEQRRTDTGFFGRLRGDGRGSCCLSPLRNLHKLRKLTLGFRLATYFERVDRDEEVKEFWRSSGSPASTALVVVGEEPRLHTWARILQTTYEPVNIAQRIADFVGHFVSLRAKEQEGGVHIVGKLCMKTSGSRFNVDLWLGRRANEREQLLRWTRPTEDIDG
ncbi:hypothetical protein MBLNU457_4834t1 [Dothideomycetes sp. NU457]